MSKEIRISTNHLHEVTLMRCCLALLIVFMHSFTCYNHSWSEPIGFVDISLYKWFARSSFAFALESFVFISGYLYAFQKITLRRTITLKSLLKNKFQRLIIPSLFFSVAYYLIFYSHNGFLDFIYSVINGCGHMWFLPMLFWCFVFIYILDLIKIKDIYKLILLISLSQLSIITIPLQLSSALSYMVYFYIGLLVYKNRAKLNKLINGKCVLLSWIIFIMVFAMLRPLRDQLVTTSDYSSILKLIIIISKNLCRFIYATIGTMVFYMTSVIVTKHYNIGTFIVRVAAASFGIYLFHQFILQWLYYKTEISLIVGPYWLPWFGFLISIISSFIISDLLLKFNVGKRMIG